MQTSEHIFLNHSPKHSINHLLKRDKPNRNRFTRFEVTIQTHKYILQIDSFLFVPIYIHNFQVSKYCAKEIKHDLDIPMNKSEEHQKVIRDTNNNKIKMVS